MLPGFDDLFRDADARPEPLPVVAAGGADPTVLEALRTAADRGWVRPIIAGRHDQIEDVARSSSINIDDFTVIDSESAALAAVAEVRSGRARILMKGQVPTPELMHAILDPAEGLRAGRSIAQVVLMEIPRDGRRFLLADTGVMIRPGLERKRDVLDHLAATAHALGVTEPRIAIMAASESVNDAMPETLHAAELQRRNGEGSITGCLVQGPLSFDLAYADDAGAKKRIDGPVVGAADAMLFPDLASANLTVKAIMYTADCRFGGVLRGAACPVAFMSRADTIETRLRSLALALKIADAGTDAFSSLHAL